MQFQIEIQINKNILPILIANFALENGRLQIILLFFFF